MSYIRTREDQLEVATVVLSNDQGHRVELVGVMHIAEQHFWDHLNARLRQAAETGEVVLLEGIRPSSEAELSALSPRQREGVESLSFLGKISKLAAQGTGAIFQRDAVQQPEDLIWHNNDFSVAQMVLAHGRFAPRLLPESVYQGIEDGLGKNPHAVLRSLRKDRTRQILRRYPALSVVGKLALRAVTGIQVEVIVDHRNRYAMSAALAMTPQPVVNIWGAGHTSGMVELLQAKGYTVRDVDWVPVFTPQTWSKLADQSA